MKISLNPLALKNMIIQKISGNLKSGDSLFFTTPSRISTDPSNKFDQPSM